MRRKSFFPHWRSILAYLQDPKSDWRPKVLFLLALAYVLFPFDLLPDLLPLIGWLDDLGLFSLATVYLLHVGNSYQRMNKKK